MTDDSATPRTDDNELSTAIIGLQDQLDQLTATLEYHQLLFERLRAQGVLPVGDSDFGSA